MCYRTELPVRRGCTTRTVQLHLLPFGRHLLCQTLLAGLPGGSASARAAGEQVKHGARLGALPRRQRRRLRRAAAAPARSRRPRRHLSTTAAVQHVQNPTIQLQLLYQPVGGSVPRQQFWSLPLWLYTDRVYSANCVGARSSLLFPVRFSE